MQQTLPRMIQDSECTDVAGWCKEHPTLSYPAEAILPPSIELCATLRVYDLLMNHEEGAMPDTRLLAWLHGERAAWKARWLSPQCTLLGAKLSRRFTTYLCWFWSTAPLDPVQLGLMKYCDRVCECIPWIPPDLPHRGLL